MASAAFDDNVKLVVPSNVNVIASSGDEQQAEEAFNVRKFELPNPAGKAGGACTSAFLKQQYAAAASNQEPQSWTEALLKMQQILNDLGYAQTLTLSSSRKIYPTKPAMQIVPSGSGRRRAMLIGINYTGDPQGELQSCHNDCQNVREFLKTVHNFRDEEMMVLMDDDNCAQKPTKDNIENGLVLLTQYSQPGDVVFLSFSGHGGRVPKKYCAPGDDDCWDSTLFPVDFKEAGPIVDNDILNMLVKPMKKGVTTTVLMDCCHSGTVLDLPYTWSAGDAKMKRTTGFNMDIVTESVRPVSQNKSKYDATTDDDDEEEEYWEDDEPYTDEAAYYDEYEVTEEEQ